MIFHKLNQLIQATLTWFLWKKKKWQMHYIEMTLDPLKIIFNKEKFISKTFFYRPKTVVTVTLYMENLICSCWPGSMFEGFCLSVNAGCFGVGKSRISLLSIEIIVDIVGLSLANSCTHSSPTCMHLNISIWKHGSHIVGSNKAIILSSFHNFHA